MFKANFFELLLSDGGYKLLIHVICENLGDKGKDAILIFFLVGSRLAKKVLLGAPMVT